MIKIKTKERSDILKHQRILIERIEQEGYNIPFSSMIRITSMIKDRFNIMLEQLFISENESEINSPLPKVTCVKGKDARRSVKPYGEKALVTSERDCGVTDHNVEHSGDSFQDKPVGTKIISVKPVTKGSVKDAFINQDLCVNCGKIENEHCGLHGKLYCENLDCYDEDSKKFQVPDQSETPDVEDEIKNEIDKDYEK